MFRAKVFVISSSDIVFSPMNERSFSSGVSIGFSLIDNNEGYHKYNIVLCCRLANLGRGSYNYEDFRRVVEYVKEEICGQKNNEE